MPDKAWVTLVTNDTYALGALVLAHSLKKVNTAHKLVVLVSSNVTFAMRGTLQSIYDEVKEVNILDSEDNENLRLLARPELGITFTKLHAWKLTQYEKCVFLDADTLVLQNCDELFEREELSAAPDVGWPDCFNSGVFVFKPSEETFKALYDFAITHGSFDGGDQGLLNMFFSDWATSDSSKRLPFLYNLSSAAIYSYLPAFKWYGRGVKIVHFIGNSKPWNQPFNSSTRSVEAASGSSHLQNFLQYWWDLFCAFVHAQLSPEMGGLANSLSQLKLDEPTPEQKAREDFLRKQNWEHGNIDYLGKDSFNNIWEKISQTMNFEPEQKSPETPSATEEVASSPKSVTEETPLSPESVSDETPESPESVIKETVSSPESASSPSSSDSTATVDSVIEVGSKPKPNAQPAEQASCPKSTAEESASCSKPLASPKPEEQPELLSCPKPVAKESTSCPKPSASFTPEEQPLSCSKPAVPESCPKSVSKETVQQPASCPLPSKPTATEPAAVSTPVAEIPVAPVPSKPAAESVSTAPALVSVPPAVPAAPTTQVPPTVEKPAAAVPEASSVRQKSAPPQAESEAKSSKETKSAPAQDPKGKSTAPAKPTSSKKK